MDWRKGQRGTEDDWGSIQCDQKDDHAINTVESIEDPEERWDTSRTAMWHYLAEAEC